jgi:predicted nucleotidyltransferase
MPRMISFVTMTDTNSVSGDSREVPTASSDSGELPTASGGSDEVPTASGGSGELPSGRFVLRIEPRLHAALREAAARAGLSLNAYCARKLAGGGIGPGAPGWRAVERATTVLGRSLVGVAVYGSWARGEPADRSDVDVLVALDDGVPLTRELYRRWDEEPVAWEGRRVEPHFVHLPPPGARTSGTWAEVALDGIVLFDPDLTLSRRLVDLRRRILDGALQRREVHGQPYWVEEE